MKINIESRDELRVIDLSEIIYLQASHNYTDFHFTDGRVKSVLSNLSSIEHLIGDSAARVGGLNPFVRLGRSILVNTSYVELVSVKLRLLAFRTTPAITLTLSRAHLLQLKELLTGGGVE